MRISKPTKKISKQKQLFFGAAAVAAALVYVIYKRGEAVALAAQMPPPKKPKPRPAPAPAPAPSQPTPQIAPVPAHQPEPQTTVVEHSAPLRVYLEARVGFPAHSAFSSSTVQNELLKKLDSVRQQLENCPGAPRLRSGTVQISKSGGTFSAATYKGLVIWQGLWPTPYFYDNTKQCMEQAVRGALGSLSQYVTIIQASRG